MAALFLTSCSPFTTKGILVRRDPHPLVASLGFRRMVNTESCLDDRKSAPGLVI